MVHPFTLKCNCNVEPWFWTWKHGYMATVARIVSARLIKMLTDGKTLLYRDRYSGLKTSERFNMERPITKWASAKISAHIADMLHAPMVILGTLSSLSSYEKCDPMSDVMKPITWSI